MASTRTTTRTIRIENDTAEYFKGKALNRAVDSLYGLLRSGELEFDGEKIKIGCVHQNEKKNESVCTPKTEKVCTPIEKDYESILEMANLMRVEPEKVIRDFKELLENGDLYYSNGKLRNPTYEEFENLCAEKKQDIGRIIYKVMREMGA